MRSTSSSLALLSALVAPAVGLHLNGSAVAPCDSPLYCYGDLLKQIQLARPYSDSKTFVDLPTVRPINEVITAFDNLTKPLSNNTELHGFLDTYFGQAGSELVTVPPDKLETDPVFLGQVDDAVIRQFVQHVIEIWPDLTRQYVGSSNCTGCGSSFIPINRTFVVAGGRFREPYYWDSFFILLGLLRAGGSFVEISKDIIENFLDFVERFGFVPNGARLYYLNRSQPPLLTQMVQTYVEYTNDSSILDRALPLLIDEHTFWMQNRTVHIYLDGQTYSLNHYAVQNTEPRPESYVEDYITANNHSYYSSSGNIYPETNPLNDSEKALLYSNLASGAESGWDYTSRWLATPRDAASDVYFPLRSLNTDKVVGVDLNSVLYANEMTIAGYLNASGRAAEGADFTRQANERATAMYALMWNDKYNSYFDYNLTSNSQNMFIPADADATAAQRAGAPEGYQLYFHVAQFYPFWLGATPSGLKLNPFTVGLAFQRVADLLDRKVGGIAATQYVTGQQWDQPNVWPPLMYVLMQGLLNTPPTFGEDDPHYAATQDLALRLAQRYLDTTFCTWRATGGSTDETPKLGGLAPELKGVLFEKYADNSTNAAGSGGEYEVVEGFGWTNGVLIWVADTFHSKLKRPDCGNITVDPPGKSSVEPRSSPRGSNSILPAL